MPTLNLASLFPLQGWISTMVRPSAAYVVTLALVTYTAHWAGLVFYRLFLHPLQKVPGPKVAAATGWYEFYHDVILDGHYIKEYPRLHEKYGRLYLESFHSHY